MNTPPIKELSSLEEFFSLTQTIGSPSRAVTNTLFGINHQQTESPIPENRDSYGLTFFTRPQLNMSGNNLRNVRGFVNLLSKQPNSIQRYTRMMLDPRLEHLEKDTHSDLVDNLNAFIPLLTNTAKNVSGWPDIVSPTFSSKQGVRREQHTMVDGTTDILDAQDISVTFRNIKESPIFMLMQTWVEYQSLVTEGVLVPYLDMILANEIDYNTRIYRLILDETKRIVKAISATGASFPINVPIGRMFDYNSSIPYNDQNKDVTINFKTNGIMYNDPILIHEFNETVGIFNPGMRSVGSGELVKIPNNLLVYLNYKGYPRINSKTYELEWYINKNDQDYIKLINN